MSDLRDECGNPIKHGGTTGGTYGAPGTKGGSGMQGVGGGHGTGGGGDIGGAGAGFEQQGQLIKPGGQKTTEPGYTGQTGQLGHEAEKKGIVEKIKEKLPGGKNTTEAEYPGQGVDVTGQGPEYTGQGEKKGMMEKIKEKLPGGKKDQGY
ncbi:uncharacterized protein LOC143884533 [Tasmannia lanceolata]|uniref:uncharacterized protein LOC143884533 n=1 Tax=Tasmannia lanceolata TaxID=3420 RepID=UPI004064722D